MPSPTVSDFSCVIALWYAYLTHQKAMVGTKSADQRAKSTRGLVSYVEKSDEDLYTIIHETKQDGRTSSNLVNDVREMDVHDVRTAGREFSLRENGLEFHRLEVPKGIDWSNSDQAGCCKPHSELCPL